jgi:hypothetical protein
MNQKKEIMTDHSTFEFAFDNENSFPDFKITCKNDEEILVHKIFLSRSIYFENMFRHNFSETNTHNAIFSDMSKLDMSFILKYFYGYKLNKNYIFSISLENSKLIFEKIHLFQIVDIYQTMVQFLYDHHETNIFEMCNYLNLYDEKKQFLHIFKNKFVSLLRTQKIESIIEYINAISYEAFISNFGEDVYNLLIEQMVEDFGTVCLFDCWVDIPKNIKALVVEKMNCKKDYYIYGRDEAIRVINSMAGGDFVSKNYLIDQIKINVRKIIR